jgi:hypothetical protein
MLKYENELKEKVEFVRQLSGAVAFGCKNIESIEYVILQSRNNENWITEFVVVHYKGGAIQARYCTGNSCGAIFEEIGKMLYTSQRYTDDTTDYIGLVDGTIGNSKVVTF